MSFNPIISAQGADGYLTFFTGPSAIAGDNDLFWDRANKRLGIGTSAPGTKFDVYPDGDYEGVLGTARIGSIISNPAFAGFTHNSNSTGQYALLQDDSANTYLNIGTGGTLYFRINNISKWIMNSSGHLIAQSDLKIQGGGGAASSPSYSFAGNTNAGIYQAHTDILGFSTGGIDKLHIGDHIVSQDGAVFKSDDGYIGQPAFTFDSDPDTGIYKYGANEIGISTGGTGQWRIATNIVALNSGKIRAGLGSVDLPTYHFVGDTDTGMYSSGANSLNFSAGNNERVAITTDIQINPATDGYLDVDGYIIPRTDNIYGLGTPDKRWSDLYVGPSTLKIISKATDPGAPPEEVYSIGIDGAGKLTISDSLGASVFSVGGGDIAFDPNFGIGTTSPGNALDIITGATTDSAVHIGEVDNEGMYFTTINEFDHWWSGGAEYVSANWTARSTSAASVRSNSGYLKFYAQDGLTDGNTFTPQQRMTIKPDGTVGIGVSDPLTELHIESAANPGIRIRENTSHASSFTYFGDTAESQSAWNKYANTGNVVVDVNPLPSDGTSSGAIRFFRDTNTTGTTALELYKGDGTGTLQARIATKTGNCYFNVGGGYTGVGTNTPYGQLHIQKGAVGTWHESMNTLIIEESGGDHGIGIIGDYDSTAYIGFGDGYDSFVGGIKYAHGTDNISLYAANAERIRVGSSADVLYAFGSSASDIRMKIENTSTGAAAIRYTNADPSDWVVGANGDDFFWYNVTNAGTKMSLTSTGKLNVFGTSTSAEFSTNTTNAASDFKIIDADGSNTRGALHVQGSSGAIEVLFASSGGNVGIGTTSPFEKFHMHDGYALTNEINAEQTIAWITGDAGDGNDHGLRISSRRLVTRTTGLGSSTAGIRMAWAPGPQSENANNGRSWYEMGNVLENNLAAHVHIWGFDGYEGAAGTEMMRLTGAGLGIGTTSPSGPLEVYPDSDVTAIIGRAKIGYHGTADTWTIGHYDRFTPTGYAIKQDQNGYTYVNSAIGRMTYFCTNNVNCFAINSVGDFQAQGTFQILADDSSSDASTPGYAFTGDANTGIFQAAADTIGFSTGGTERMRIDSDGDVGIGTDLPNYKLHVRGTGDCLLTVEGSTASFVRMFDQGAGTDLKYTDIVNNDGTFVIRSLNDDFSIKNVLFASDAAGKVGIGITSPAELFHVQGTTAATIKVNANTTPWIAGLSINSGSSGGESAGIYSYGTTGEIRHVGATNYWHSFYTHGAEAMRINTSGHVGIGTTNPLSLLHVKVGTDQNLRAITSSGFTTLTARNDANSADVPIMLKGEEVYFDTGLISWVVTSDGDLRSNGSVQLLGRDTSAAAPMYSFASDTDTGIYRITTDTIGFSTGSSEKMRIDASGHVGIGTPTIPHGGIGSAMLALDGTNISTAGPHIQITTTADDYPVFQQLNYGHDNISFGFDMYWDGAWKSSDAGSNFQIYKLSDKLSIKYDSGIAQGSGVSMNDGIVLDTSGNVGIGISSPERRLHIQGNSAGAWTPNGSAVVAIEHDSSAFLHFGTPNSNESGLLFGDVDADITGGVLYSNTYDRLAFRTNGNTDRWYFDSAGDFVAAGSYQILADDNSSGATAPAYSFIGDTDTGMYQINGNQMAFSCGGSEAMRITSSRDVNIGSTGAYRLYVYDNASATQAAYFHNAGSSTDRYGIGIRCGDNAGTNVVYIMFYDGDNTYVGTLYSASGALGLWNASDETLKENIGPTQISGLDIVSKIDLIEFNFAKHGPEGKHRIGFSAQNCEIAYPEMVRDAPEAENQKMVSQDKLIPVLTKAIQEQQEMIEELKARIEALENN